MAFLVPDLGVFGAIVLFAVPFVGDIYTKIAGTGQANLILRAIVAAICLLPPTLLMGATLPAIARWVATGPGYDFLAEDPATRSCTSICLKITAPWFTVMGAEAQAAAAKKIALLLEKEGVALDAGAYRDVVLYNSAAALLIAGKAATLRAGVQLAAEAIDSGKARATLQKLVAITNSKPPA